MRQGLTVALVDDPRRAGIGSNNNPGGLNPLHGPGIPGPMATFALKALGLRREHQLQIAGLCGRREPILNVTSRHFAGESHTDMLEPRNPAFAAAFSAELEALDQ